MAADLKWISTFHPSSAVRWMLILRIFSILYFRNMLFETLQSLSHHLLVLDSWGFQWYSLLKFKSFVKNNEFSYQKWKILWKLSLTNLLVNANGIRCNKKEIKKKKNDSTKLNTNAECLNAKRRIIIIIHHQIQIWHCATSAAV